MRIISVHGYNVTDGGERTLGRLEKVLRGLGHTIIEVDTLWLKGGPGIRNVLRVRSQNRQAVDRVWAAAMVSQPVAAIGHSNGAAILWQAQQIGAKFQSVVLINPALRQDAHWKVGLGDQGKVLCMYSPHDAPTGWARLLHLLPTNFFLGAHPWGAAGRYGLDQGRMHGSGVMNRNLERLFEGERVGHSDAFASKHVRRLSTVVHDFIEGN